MIDRTKHEGLEALPGFPFAVRTSASTRERAAVLAQGCAWAFAYLGDLLDFRPECAVVVLDRADWAERASNPLYGMPYYNVGNLFLAGEPSDLAARLGEVAAAAPPEAARVFDQVYGTGADRLTPFTDLLVVHEMAHAFHDGVPFVFPRAWLMELFADMALCAYVTDQEPESGPKLHTLPRLALKYGLLTPVTRDLRSFEARYPYLEALTMVWYQFRFTVMAQELIDAAGPSVLRRLWDSFAFSDQRLSAVLAERVHPRAGRWPLDWDGPRAEG